jgi:hypothetical protein
MRSERGGRDARTINTEEHNMATIEEELNLARQAKAAIEARRSKEMIEILRKATRMATEQIVLSSADPLNDARHNVGIAVPPYTAEQRQPTQGEIVKAKNAIETWIREVEATTP